MNKTRSNNLLAWLEIDRQKIRQNLRAIRKLTSNTPILAMVKANAYGMGLIEVARVLKSEGVQAFGVASINEALKLRALDKSSTVINFEPMEKDNFRKAMKYDITPVASRPEDFFLLENTGKEINVFIKVNTGLNRWGLSCKEALFLAKKVNNSKRFKISALVTTLVENPRVDKKQIESLYKLKRDLKSLNIAVSNISFASSQGILALDLENFYLIRPGIALYGIYPDKELEQESKILLQPIFSLKSKISQIRTIKKGEKVLYKNTFTAPQEMMVAVLPIGYVLGYNPRFQGKAQLLAGGKRCPVIGISMSTTIIDISRLNNPKIGQEVVLIGSQGKENVSLSELTKISELSRYFLMASLSENLTRIYFD